MPRGLALLAVGAVVATGCRQLFGLDDTTVAGDAGAPGPDAGQEPDASQQPDAVVGPWTLLGPLPLGSPGANDDDPSLTEDRLEMYFNSDREGDLDLFVSRRIAADQAWGIPTRVVELSSTLAETTPEVALDGLTIYFASDRLGAGYDIYTAQRANRFDPWSLPVMVDDLSTAQLEYPGCATADGSSMLVSRATAGDYDVYLATQQGATFTLEVVPGLDTTASDVAGCMSPDLGRIYFESNRLAGSIDLFAGTRALLGAYDVAPITELNTSAADDDIWVSPDGRHLYFHSDRGGLHQIYEATR